MCEEDYTNIAEAEQALRGIREETSGVASLADTILTTSPEMLIGTIGELRDISVEIVDACDYIHKNEDDRLKCILTNRKSHDEAMGKIAYALKKCMK